MLNDLTRGAFHCTQSFVCGGFQIYDKSHSDSELSRCLLDENRDTWANAGVAHAPNSSRRTSLVKEQKQNRQQMGGLNGSHALEYYAGTQYASITTEQIWFERLVSYGGRNMHNEGRPFLNRDDLPNGIFNTRICPDATDGGTHPLGPEYVFNAKRPMAFRAGSIDLETNEPIDIHSDFFDVSQYWTDSGEFVLPACSKKNDGFFFLVDPYVTNIFDVALPRPIYGSASAGPHLLQLYRDNFGDAIEAAGGTNASLSDCFNEMMSEKDPLQSLMEKQMSETVISFDSIDATDLERKGLRHYGEVDTSNSYIIEPRQVLKQIQLETRRVIYMLINPWLKKREELRTLKNEEIRTSKQTEAFDEEDYYMADEDDGANPMEADYHDDIMKEVRNLEDETTLRHCNVMKDLIFLHVSRIEDAFRSKMERETIPAGYQAMFDGLQVELAKMPNNTANIAFTYDMRLAFDDVSSFAQINLWLGSFWETDCFSTYQRSNTRLIHSYTVLERKLVGVSALIPMSNTLPANDGSCLVRS